MDKNIEIIKEIQRTGKVPAGTKMTYDVTCPFDYIVETVQSTGKAPNISSEDLLAGNYHSHTTWQHDQSILHGPYIGDLPPGTIPNIGDWPPSPTPCDPLPATNKTTMYGWICPKCGRCLAPHLDGCPYCNADNDQLSTINTTL